MEIRLATATLLMAMGLAQSVAGRDAGKWILRTGFHSIEPRRTPSMFAINSSCPGPVRAR
jgi:outer membrane protein W